MIVMDESHDERSLEDPNLDGGVILTEATLVKSWSIMDAASEKEKPSDYLDAETIAAIQGKA